MTRGFGPAFSFRHSVFEWLPCALRTITDL